MKTAAVLTNREWTCRLRLPEDSLHDNPQDCIAETHSDLLDASRLFEKARAALSRPTEHDEIDLRLLRAQLHMHRQALEDSASQLHQWFQRGAEWSTDEEEG